MLRPNKRRCLASNQPNQAAATRKETTGPLSSWLVQKLSIYDKRQLDFDLDITELLVGCSLPFYIVESASFKKFMAKHHPKMTIKVATTFSR